MSESNHAQSGAGAGRCQPASIAGVNRRLPCLISAAPYRAMVSYGVRSSLSPSITALAHQLQRLQPHCSDEIRLRQRMRHVDYSSNLPLSAAPHTTDATSLDARVANMPKRPGPPPRDFHARPVTQSDFLSGGRPFRDGRFSYGRYGKSWFFYTQITIPSTYVKIIIT
ncbi:MAG: hypothetical protein GPOALKHO_001551 [Sodalis sp.]|nr:MAG: hypothetical protein GPOALKHO_001551 [Sodalis sp.]